MISLLLLTVQASTADLVYVANQDVATVTIIDAHTNTPVDTVDLTALGFTANAKPHHVVVEPDGSSWYVSLIGDNVVVKFDQSNHVIGRASFEAPGMLAIHPERDLLFVTRSMSAVNPPQRIGVVRRSNMEIDELDVFFPRPHAIAVDPDGDFIYVGSLGENRIISVNLDTDEVAFTDVGGAQHSFVQFAVSPVSRSLVATTELTGQLLVFDITTPGQLVPIHALHVNAAPWDPVFSRDGRYVFFGNQRTNTVTVVDTNGWKVIRVIEHPALAQPYGSALSPDGMFVYIANRHIGAGDHAAHGTGSAERDATVLVIDAASLSVSGVIHVSGDATGIGSRRVGVAHRQ